MLSWPYLVSRYVFIIFKKVKIVFPRPHEKEVDILFPNLLILFVGRFFMEFK